MGKASDRDIAAATEREVAAGRAYNHAHDKVKVWKGVRDELWEDYFKCIQDRTKREAEARIEGA